MAVAEQMFSPTLRSLPYPVTCDVVPSTFPVLLCLERNNGSDCAALGSPALLCHLWHMVLNPFPVLLCLGKDDGSSHEAFRYL